MEATRNTGKVVKAMTNPTARIRPAKDGALWLFVDPHGENKVSADELTESIKEHLSLREPGAIAYAILPEEVEAIRDACNDWLERESQEWMKP